MVTISHNRSQSRDRVLTFERDYPERLTGMSDYYGVGAIEERTKMDDKMMGMVRHVLTAVGAVMVYMGWTDDGTWTTAMGGILTMVPFVWSWVSKPAV